MKVVDFIHFKYDFIYLAHHLGIGITGNLFSILSMKNQRIFVFEIDFELGKLEEIQQIARNSIPEAEEGGIVKIPEEAQRDDSWGRPGVNGFNLKLIKHLSDYYGLEQIPLPGSILSVLHVWKHQILSNGKILLRLAPSNFILSTNPRHQSMVHALDPLPSIHKHSYLVLMDRVSGNVESVLNSADPRLLDWLKDNWKWLKGSSSEFDGFEVIFDEMKAVIV